MYKSNLAAKLFAALWAILFTYVASSGGEATSGVQSNAELLAQISWGDLALPEREELLTLFLSLPRGEYLEGSAYQFMLRLGYSITEVMGPIRLEGEEDPLLVAFREGKAYAVSIPAVGAPLHPGVYWTQGMGAAWTVIQPDGAMVTYWVDHQLQGE